MTTKYIFLNFFIASGLLFFSGCTKDFKEINTNPVLVTKEVIKPGLLFTPVLKLSIFNTLNTLDATTEYAGYYKNPASGDIFK
ncbi:MAG: hypothetical protein ABI687_11410, partial [Flavitalea sp.]